MRNRRGLIEMDIGHMTEERYRQLREWEILTDKSCKQFYMGTCKPENEENCKDCEKRECW